MDAEKYENILLETLRIGLIAIRNLANTPKRTTVIETMLTQWAELCHSLPAILLGKCDARAVAYFLHGDMAQFCANYPTKEHADFGQIAALKLELEIVASVSLH